MTPIRILIVTHSAVLFTGMAEVIRLIFTSLIQRFPGKYVIEQLGLLHMAAVCQPPWPIYATRVTRGHDGVQRLDPNDILGQQSLPEVLERFLPDIVFAHNDPQNLPFLGDIVRARGCKLVFYVNFDGVPVPSDYKRLFRGAHIVTMSEFSKSAFLACGREEEHPSVEVMYCPADTERFQPVTREEKHALRKANFPAWLKTDGFVIGWVGRNQWRKQVWILYEVLHLLRSGSYCYCKGCGTVVRDIATQPGGSCRGCDFVEATPLRDLFLWLHMPNGKESGCWSLDQLERLFGVRDGEDLLYTPGCSVDMHLAPEDMPRLYNMWDAFVFPSGGEGFGLPPWEAMASGLPIVYSNYSSHAEYIRMAGAGLPIGGVLQPDAENGVLRLVSSVEEAVASVRRLYRFGELRAELGRRGRQFVEGWSPVTMAEKWDDLFVRILR